MADKSYFVKMGKAVVTPRGIRSDGQCVDDCGLLADNLAALADKGYLTTEDPCAGEKKVQAERDAAAEADRKKTAEEAEKKAEKKADAPTPPAPPAGAKK